MAKSQFCVTSVIKGKVEIFRRDRVDLFFTRKRRGRIEGILMFDG